MKKKLGLIVSAMALIVVMLVSLCACGSTWGKIKSAYEKEGYEETDAEATQTAIIEGIFGKDKESAFTVHVMKKGDGLIASVAIIVEFKSTKEMEEMLKDKVTAEDAKNVYDELQKLDTVNGNCFFCGVAGGDIFKGTK